MNNNKKDLNIDESIEDKINIDKNNINESSAKENSSNENGTNKINEIESVKNEDPAITNVEVKTKNISPKKMIILGGCALTIGLGALTLTQVFNNQDIEFEDFIVNNSKAVDLEFTIKDGGIERNRTSQEMREFYTPEGEEFIKTLYPESSDSDLALVTIGKSISKEFSNIEFTTADNKKIKLKNLKGKKIILDFALTTCPSCQEEFKYLPTSNIEEDAVFLHIFPRNTTEEIKEIYKELGVEFNSSHTVSATGMDSLTFEDFNITHVPTKIYINEDGIVTYVTTTTLLDDETYNLHYDRAFGEGKKVLDFLTVK